jgi:hypothetical protein
VLITYGPTDVEEVAIGDGSDPSSADWYAVLLNGLRKIQQKVDNNEPLTDAELAVLARYPNHAATSYSWIDERFLTNPALRPAGIAPEGKGTIEAPYEFCYSWKSGMFGERNLIPYSDGVLWHPGIAATQQSIDNIGILQDVDAGAGSIRLGRIRVSGILWLVSGLGETQFGGFSAITRFVCSFAGPTGALGLGVWASGAGVYIGDFRDSVNTLLTESVWATSPRDGLWRVDVTLTQEGVDVQMTSAGGTGENATISSRVPKRYWEDGFAGNNLAGRTVKYGTPLFQFYNVPVAKCDPALPGYATARYCSVRADYITVPTTRVQLPFIGTGGSVGSGGTIPGIGNGIVTDGPSTVTGPDGDAVVVTNPLVIP